ncbi:unnamed protein product [Eruca vesicaria subsp. sativa]|uniref:Uncharacterized protein n=1 Tax=Eruca vesicaria subsp. sativa TaxID=29727 RepID=A0ABC8K0Y4_ERUVS|nr:unnamed protein product [Eruca vesicaria subsp. sativa]
MEHYNNLGEVVYSEKVKHWRFRVKIIRIYPFYSYVTCKGPHHVYVLEDEHANVGRAHSGFKVTKSKFTLTATGDTQIHIIDPLNNQLYFEFKGIHEIPHMSYKEINFPIVVFKTKAHFDDPEGPKMVFYIRDNIESQIKCVATRKHAYAFREGFENMGGSRHVIVVLKMWRKNGFRPRGTYLTSGSLRAYQR